MTGPVAAQMILHDPTIDAAVLETARGGLVRRGMGYRMCDVGACINVSGDHLGLGGVDTLEQLAEVKRIVVEVATDTAVLNADDELCLKMADYTTAKHLCYVTMNPRHPLVREHIRAGRAGGRARGRAERPADRALRHRPAHPAALDPPDPGDDGGPRDAQRAERDVRHRRRLQPGQEARGHPPRAAHLRHLVLPGAGPDERVQRAPVQGDPRLRPQPGRGPRHVQPGRAHAGARAQDRRAHHAGRPARRGHRRGGGDRRRTFRPLLPQARRQPARPQAGRGAEAAGGGPARARGRAARRSRAWRTSRRRCRRRSRWPSPTISC